MNNMYDKDNTDIIAEKYFDGNRKAAIKYIALRGEYDERLNCIPEWTYGEKEYARKCMWNYLKKKMSHRDFVNFLKECAAHPDKFESNKNEKKKSMSPLR